MKCFDKAVLTAALNSIDLEMLGQRMEELGELSSAMAEANDLDDPLNTAIVRIVASPGFDHRIRKMCEEHDFPYTPALATVLAGFMLGLMTPVEVNSEETE